VGKSFQILRRELRPDDGGSSDRANERIDSGNRTNAANPKPGMTAGTLANNTAENAKRAQATQNLHKAWHHIW
jgi:hypothetical protein